METDYQKLLDNLTVLLQDICQFLSSDRIGILSHRDKRLMESLVTRSKVQLQEIAHVEKVSEEYVDMDAKKVLVIQEEDEKPDIYSSVDDINKHDDTMMQGEIMSPYIDLPAKEASLDIKYGYISMKRKILWGFQQMKRVYATIHNQWLLIYVTERDTRPISTFNLKNYEAREVDASKSSNFELIGNSSDRKTYYFMALTPKDMLQWVVNINRCHDNVIVQSKGLDIEEEIEFKNDPEEPYDIIMQGAEQSNYELEEEEEEIYSELNEIEEPTQNNNTIPRKEPTVDSFGPPLPGRRPLKPLVPVPPPIINPTTSSHGSEESLVSYNCIEELVNELPPDKDGLPSENEEESIYEEFVSVKQNIIKRSSAIPPEEVTRDSAKLEIDKVTRTPDDEPDPKSRNEPSVSIKHRIEKYQKLNPTTEEKNASFDETSNLSFIHRTAGARNRMVSPNQISNQEARNDRDEANRSSNPPSSDAHSPNVKKLNELNPPVLPKVPVLPVKPKVRDGQPSINKRSPFSTFKQTILDS